MSSDQGPSDDEIEAGIEALSQSTQIPTFIRMVPIGQTIPGFRGARLVLTSVEIWSSLIVVHSASVGADISINPDGDPEDTAARMARMSQDFMMPIRDDRGNEYPRVGGVGGGGGDPANAAVWSIASFSGSLAPDATKLYWQVASAEPPVTVTIDL
jgi:hypothetical protein